MLRVERMCRCGCATVTFGVANARLSLRNLAEGVGTTPDGHEVGVAVWGNDEQVTRLEVFRLEESDAECDELTLPVPETIRLWPAGAARILGHF